MVELQSGVQVLSAIEIPLPGRTVGLVASRVALNRRFQVEEGQPSFPPLEKADENIAGNPLTGATVTPGELPSRAVATKHNTGDDWFEKVHIWPDSTANNPARLQRKKLDFGIILGNEDKEYEVYNAWRHLDVTINSITNNTAPGTELPNVTPPVVIAKQSSLLSPASTFNFDGTSGLGVLVRDVVRALLEGLSTFDDRLTFNLSTADAPYLELKGARIALFLAKPEMPFQEILEASNDIIEATDGGTQRINVRPIAREIYRFRYRLHGLNRQTFQAYLFDRQSFRGGLPLWHELTVISADVGIGVSTISVVDADQSDFRVGGLVMLYTDDLNLETIEILTVTPTLITLNGVTGAAYTAGIAVALPVRTAIISNVPTGSQFPVTLEDVTLEWTVDDVETGAPAGSSTAWNSTTYLGKPLLDECNFMDGGVSPTTYERRVTVVDNGTGLIHQGSQWQRGKRGSSKGFIAHNRGEVSDLRAFLRWVRGEQRTFYLATGIDDLTVTDNLSSGSPLMLITKIEYGKFIGSREPMKTFRITYTDGTSEIKVVSTSVDDADPAKEELTLTTTWGANHDVSTIARVEFIQEVHFDTMRFRMKHQRVGLVTMTAPVLTAFDAD